MSEQEKKYEYEYYGIWSSTSNSWVFGIYAPTKELAYEALFKRIGKDAYKWRFSAKRIPKEELSNFLKPKRKFKKNTQQISKEEK